MQLDPADFRLFREVARCCPTCGRAPIIDGERCSSKAEVKCPLRHRWCTVRSDDVQASGEAEWKVCAWVWNDTLQYPQKPDPQQWPPAA